MTIDKAAILAQLQREILPLQGLHGIQKNVLLDTLLGPIKHAFPNNSFPLAAVHEFISHTAEDAAATSGFVGGLMSALMKKEGISIWISSNRSIFPPALRSLGIAADRIIFIDLKKEKEILWAMEEALKCQGIASVIGELPGLGFTASRRLQLAVESSQVTGFILRRNPRNINTTACVTRWKITSLQSEPVHEMPGVGFPKWKVDLLKVRNGKPGTWEVELVSGKFRHTSQSKAIQIHSQKKAV